MDRIDSDADGYITTAELKAWIKRVQKRYVYENVAKVWTDYDLNKDNKISWDEYKQATYGYYLGMGSLVQDTWCIFFYFFLVLKYYMTIKPDSFFIHLFFFHPLSQPGRI